EQLIRLPKQSVDAARAVELRGVLHASIEPRSALDAVVTGELVDGEQVAVVEDEALRVFIRQLTDCAFVRPHNELGDRLDGLRTPRLHTDERIAVFETDGRHHAAHRAVT